MGSGQEVEPEDKAHESCGNSAQSDKQGALDDSAALAGAECLALEDLGVILFVVVMVMMMMMVVTPVCVMLMRMMLLHGSFILMM